MSDTQQSTTGTPRQAPHAADVPYTAPSRSEPTAWAGLVLFGGIMIVMVGGFQCIQGFVALFRDDYYLVSRTGLVAVATGIGVLLGQMWARVLGIVVAVVSALVNVAFLAAYPVWSTIVIALDVLVIYAFAVHGREIRDA